MTEPVPMQQAVEELRRLYAADSQQAEFSIERYLEDRLKEHSPEERLAYLRSILRTIKGSEDASSDKDDVEEALLHRLFSLVLGENISREALSSDELLDRLAASLNTIFDSLNQLVALVNATFAGESVGEETIRHRIGDHMQGSNQLKGLESYLGQIRKAFLLTHDAFKMAAQNITAALLRELDPDRLGEGLGGGLKIGPLRKADIYDAYEEKYKKCINWLTSDRYMEVLLREFEKNCRQAEM
jgi:hypothetical protein